MNNPRYCSELEVCSFSSSLNCYISYYTHTHQWRRYIEAPEAYITSFHTKYSKANTNENKNSIEEAEKIKKVIVIVAKFSVLYPHRIASVHHELCLP